MAWPWLAIIARNVPWAELVRRAPDIIERSRQLLDESRQRQTKAPATLENLRQRVELLEQRDAEHARIIAAMVEQLQGLTDATQVLTARLRLLTWVVAALLALLAGILVWRSITGT